MISTLVGDRLTHRPTDRLEGQPVLRRDLRRVVEGQRDDQDRDGGRTQNATDD